MIPGNKLRQVTSGMLGCDWEKKFSVDMHDLDLLSASSGQEEVSQVITKYSTMMGEFVENLKSSVKSTDEAAGMLRVMGHVMHRAWAVPTHGNTMGYELCDVMRKTGGLDLLIQNCGATTDDVDDVQFSSARVLEQCLTTDNRNYVVKNGLEEVVSTARSCVIHKKTLEHARVGTGILAHLFKHSEMTCSDVMKMGGLKAVLQQCRESDLETLRHCASAIANLSLYGDSENHQAMINSQVQFWLFPLVVNPDDNIKYYSCLAVAALVANKEIEASVDKSGTLKCVEQFVTSHDPADFARSSVAHVHGQSKEWLQRLVPVLNSKRSEACSLAAFHFAMEAGIKKNQGKTDVSIFPTPHTHPPLV